MKQRQLISFFELHLNKNKIPVIMAKAAKKKSTAPPGSVTKKAKSTSSKKSKEGSPKKTRQKGKGTGVRKEKSTDAPPVARTPDRKQRKLPPSPSTPSTVSSKSTTKSKRAISMMSSLALKTPPKKIKCQQDVASKASLCDTVDLNDAAMIEWTCKKGLRAALEHHFDDHEDFEGLDYHDKVKLLCNQFTPADIRPVLQVIWQDAGAGKDWRFLKLKKHRSMKALAPEFAKACVDIVNAKVELLESEGGSVPWKIIVMKEKVEQSEDS